MNKHDLIERELKNLDIDSIKFQKKVERVLSKYRGEEVVLYINQNNRYRLLTLKVWMDKYKISLRFILQTLVPFWEKFLNKRTKKLKSKGLNVQIATLVGKKSEQILQESITNAFPHNEHKQLWVMNHKERIIQHELHRMEKRSDDGVVVKQTDPSRSRDDSGDILSLTDFSTPVRFIRYYRKYIERENITREHIEEEMKKRRYRNNPFTERM